MIDAALRAALRKKLHISLNDDCRISQEALASLRAYRRAKMANRVLPCQPKVA